MKKILEKNLIQACELMENDFNMSEALEHLKIASLTLKDIFQNSEISQSEREKLDIYHDDILSRIGLCYWLKTPADERKACKAFAKVKNKADYVEVAEGLCLLTILEDEFDRSVASEMIRKLHKVDEVNLYDIKIPYALAVYRLALYRLAEIYYTGTVLGNANLAAKDESKGIRYLKTFNTLGLFPEAIDSFIKKYQLSISSESLEFPKMTKRPQSNPEMRKVTVKREKLNLNSFEGCAVALEIYLDGVIVGSVGIGQEFSFYVSKDAHNIQIRMRNILSKAFGGKGTQSRILVIAPGDKEYVYFVETVVYTGGVREVKIEEVAHCIPGKQDWVAIRESKDAKWIADAVKNQFEKGGAYYQLLQAGVKRVHIIINEDTLRFGWTTDMRSDITLKYDMYGTMRICKDTSVNSISEMFEAIGRTKTYTWEELSREFSFIKESVQRKEMSQMIYEKIQELGYIGCEKPDHMGKASLELYMLKERE